MKFTVPKILEGTPIRLVNRSSLILKEKNPILEKKVVKNFPGKCIVPENSQGTF